MVSCALVLVPLWILGLSGGCRAEELPREVVLSWFSGRVLEGLGLEEPPLASAQGPMWTRPSRGERGPCMGGPRGAGGPGRTSGPVPPRTSPRLFSSLVLVRSFYLRLLLDPENSSCGSETSSSHFTYYFQPSLSEQEAVVTAAHFWFYAGEGGNMSAPLFILTSAPQLLQAAEAPSQRSPDGWTTYDLERAALASVAQGPFILQVRCAACECHADQPDKTPFLDLTAQPRARVKSRRHAPLSIPWSPSAVDLLQRPSVERPEHSDCQRAHVEISFKELGWDNWIVHPTALTFYYCHGNCSAGDRTTASLGIRQCCAPVPGSMRSLRITTTSDGGYSFKKAAEEEEEEEEELVCVYMAPCRQLSSSPGRTRRSRAAVQDGKCASPKKNTLYNPRAALSGTLSGDDEPRQSLNVMKSKRRSLESHVDPGLNGTRACGGGAGGAEMWQAFKFTVVEMKHLSQHSWVSGSPSLSFFWTDP
ncbi:unnamed protein product [Pleuronectes platessa]|uniref:Inhibin alpha chain n=1 Tax=Pleuronectes platessa TaxID=8262 RepID=A0A9N7TNS1_PLEPL|nr:unnamed protein product [Pleuronectes platessa]